MPTTDTDRQPDRYGIAIGDRTGGLMYDSESDRWLDSDGNEPPEQRRRRLTEESSPRAFWGG
jgi:hypothetical protein